MSLCGIVALKGAMVNGEYITVQDAAKALRVHEQTIRGWIRKKALQAFIRPGAGRRVFIKRDSVAKLKMFKPK